MTQPRRALDQAGGVLSVAAFGAFFGVISMLAIESFKGPQPLERSDIFWPALALVGVVVLGCISRRLLQGSPCNPRTVSPAVHAHVGRKRADTYKAPFPNAWYKLCDAEQVTDKPLQIEALGTSMVVYRGAESGQVFVLDAYCIHLGANLAAGGKVKGDCIQCPFHLWEFNGDGKVMNIPYTDRIPENAKTRSWPCVELHGMILVYFDAEKRDPPYQPRSFEEIHDGRMVYRGRHYQDVRMHLQEFAENSVDFAHFEPLHGTFTVPFTNIPLKWVKIQHAADWIQGDADKGEGHITYFLNNAYLYLSVNGKRWNIPRTSAKATITFDGPGSVVSFRFEIPDVGSIIMFQTHTPIEPHPTLQTEFLWFAEPHIPRLMVKYVIDNWISQWANDIMVWENKIHLPKPHLVKGDGPFFKLRSWYNQFYSESSAKVLRCGSKELEW